MTSFIIFILFIVIVNAQFLPVWLQHQYWSIIKGPPFKVKQNKQSTPIEE